MTGKRNLKKEIREWYDENKTAIKAGVICLGIGAFYGFVKGVGACNTSMSRLIDKIPYDPDPGDVSEWLYSNLDKPELLEEVRTTIKEIDNL